METLIKALCSLAILLIVFAIVYLDIQRRDYEQKYEYELATANAFAERNISLTCQNEELARQNIELKAWVCSQKGANFNDANSAPYYDIIWPDTTNKPKEK